MLSHTIIEMVQLKYSQTEIFQFFFYGSYQSQNMVTHMLHSECWGLNIVKLMLNPYDTYFFDELGQIDGLS